MDSNTLVEEQLKAGQLLLERLNAHGVPVVGAAWIKKSESDQWYLYLVTPLVGADGTRKPAYRRITPVVRELQGEGCWIDPFEVKVIAPGDTTGAALAELNRRFPGRMATRYAGASLGDMSVEGAYVYPIASPAAT